MIKIISFSFAAILLTCFKLNAQVLVSDNMMPFTTENKLEDSTLTPGVNTVITNVNDQIMPFNGIVETEEKSKIPISGEDHSLPEKASDKKMMLNPKKE